MRHGVLVGVLTLSSLLIYTGCGNDNPPASDEDTGVDSGEPDVETDTEEDVETDTSDEDTADVADEETGDELCPGSIVCLSERTGQPSLAVCTEAGYPEGTTCERTEEAACCVAPFACATDDECEALRLEDRMVCTDDRFPCVCHVESGECRLDLCSTAADCADGEQCVDGLCGEPDALTYVARILTRPQVIADGATLMVDAVAVSDASPDITHPGLDISWEASTGTIDADGIYTADGDAGTVTITARVTSNAADPGDTVELAIVDTSEARQVVVIDDSTREPLVGATVLIDDGDTVITDVTADDGSVEVTAEGAVDVHVFADDYQTVSAYGVASDSLLLPISSVQWADVQEVRDGYVCPEGGYVDERESCGGAGQEACLCYQLHNVDAVHGEPSFDEVAGVGELWVSLTGIALGNSLLDLNFDLLIGPSIDRVLPEGSPIMAGENISMPSGVTLHFNTNPLVGSFVATAAPGERSLWSIGGIISLSDNPDLIPDLLQSTGGDVDMGRAIAALLPLFEDFYSGVVTGLPMAAEGTLPIRSPEVTLSVPTRRRVTFDAPALPTIDGMHADTGVFLAGIMAPGEGLVPLGITAGIDSSGDGDPADGVLDGNTDTLDTIDPMHVAVAPMHSGMNTPATRYMMASVALYLSEGSPSNATSGVLTVLEPGEALPADLEIGESFPSFAEGSTWDSVNRTLVIVPPETGADLYRIVFNGRAGQNWVIYADGDTTELTVPAAPEGMADAVTSEPLVIALTLADEADGYAGLIAPNGANLTELVESVRTFSVYEAMPR